MKEVSLRHGRFVIHDNNIIESMPYEFIEATEKDAECVELLIKQNTTGKVGILAHWGGDYAHSVTLDCITRTLFINEICSIAICTHTSASEVSAEHVIQMQKLFDREKDVQIFHDRDTAYQWLEELLRILQSEEGKAQ